MKGTDTLNRTALRSVAMTVGSGILLVAGPGLIVQWRHRRDSAGGSASLSETEIARPTQSWETSEVVWSPRCLLLRWRTGSRSSQRRPLVSSGGEDGAFRGGAGGPAAHGSGEKVASPRPGQRRQMEKGPLPRLYQLRTVKVRKGCSPRPGQRSPAEERKRLAQIKAGGLRLGPEGFFHAA